MNIAVLTSGGVDSSTSLYLLKKQKHNLTAFYIKVWLEEDFSHCPWKEDLKYVRAVCKKVKVPLKVVSLQKEYWEYIIQYTLKTLKEGKTPNPDIFCNTLIKFGVFINKYGKSFDKIATGHYARLTHNSQVISHNDKIRLLRARDRNKDQTYFLSQVKVGQLERLLFPIGDMLKSDVRKLAKKAGLVTYDRPDSQGLCFLGKISFPEFLKKYVGEKPGNIIDIETSDVIGKHRGFWFYTIGQREGLGIGGSDKPYYVASKDTKRNIVYVAKGHDNKYLLTNEVKLHNLNILAPELLKKDGEYLVKLRHPHEGINGKIIQLSPPEADQTLAGKNTIVLKLKIPAFGVTEGQFGVLYDGDVVVASGKIVN